MVWRDQGRLPALNTVAGESSTCASPLNERTLDRAGDRMGCRTDPPSEVGIPVSNPEADIKSGPIEARGPTNFNDICIVIYVYSDIRYIVYHDIIIEI